MVVAGAAATAALAVGGLTQLTPAARATICSPNNAWDCSSYPNENGVPDPTSSSCDIGYTGWLAGYSNAQRPAYGSGCQAYTTASAVDPPTCDPEGDPNCPPPPPTGPPPGGPPPIPVPFTGYNDPICHAWPVPVTQTEQCATAATGYTACSAVHAVVLGHDTGPITVPIPVVP